MSAATHLDAAHRADVVIIGAGIMGASTAYHLARAGVTDVVVLEAGRIAGGSSGKPLGGVRVQFSDPANIELGLRSLHAYGRFDEELGVDIGLRRVGYLFALRDPADVAPFEAGITLQNELGAVSRVVAPAEATRLCRYLDPSSLVAAAWSPGDGFARPAAAVHGYLDAATALGVSVRTRARVVAIDGAAAGEALVRTADGTRFATPTVVCATGAWAREIGDMVGVALPVEPLRRQIAFTRPCSRCRPPSPSPSTTPRRRTSTARRTAGSCWACPTRPSPSGSTAPSPTPGTPGSARRCRRSPPSSPGCPSSAAGPACTR
jgi:sarcosine oxidase subunit beta